MSRTDVSRVAGQLQRSTALPSSPTTPWPPTPSLAEPSLPPHVALALKALVVMSDFEPVAPPVFRFRESILGNEAPEPYVFLTDRRQEDDEADQRERPPQKG